MPKLKTKKKTAKRFRITKNGKVLSKKPGRRHLLADKAKKSKRQMRTNKEITGGMSLNIKAQLPYA
jgi:large subunit ribosomal protein L35